MEWNNRSDEILELKKIFYEFIKNTVSTKENNIKAELILYERNETDEYYTLDSLTGYGNQTKGDIENESVKEEQNF